MDPGFGIDMERLMECLKTNRMVDHYKEQVTGGVNFTFRVQGIFKGSNDSKIEQIIGNIGNRDYLGIVNYAREQFKGRHNFASAKYAVFLSSNDL